MLLMSVPVVLPICVNLSVIEHIIRDKLPKIDMIILKMLASLDKNK